MTKPMWPASGEDARHHGRLDLCYNARVETPPQYGLARRHKKTGVLEFLCEQSFSISWETNAAMVRYNPSRIEDYEQDPKYDMFIVNFNKKTSPVHLLERISKYNFAIGTN